ncbi:Secretory lipase family protein [Candida albicans]|nr:Secretory lipase family protein [Candida albicans]
MSQYFTGQNRAFEKGWGLLQDEVFNKTIEDNLLLKLDKTYLPQVPVLIYHGTIDEIIPIKDANAQYQIWCDRGIQSLEFAEDLSAGHLAETFTGAPAALSWIDARFSGKPAVNGCQRTIRSSNVLYPGISITIRIYFEGISKTIFGVNLGSGVNADKSISNKFFAYIRKYI